MKDTTTIPAPIRPNAPSNNNDKATTTATSTPQ